MFTLIFNALLSLGSLLFVYGIFAISFWILLLIGQWFIFTKAGEAGWKSLIPFLNGHVCYRICWKPMYYWIFLLLGAVTSWISSNTDGNIFLLFLSFARTVGALVIHVLFSIRLSKAFGHGASFAVGLILLPSIFTMILGLGSSQYVGHPDSASSDTVIVE